MGGPNNDAVAALRALEVQEAQLAQMLEFTEKELRKNMDGLRTDLGGSISQGKKRIEEALRASLKEDDAALVTVRGTMDMQEWQLTQLVNFTDRGVSSCLEALRKNMATIRGARENVEKAVRELMARPPPPPPAAPTSNAAAVAAAGAIPPSADALMNLKALSAAAAASQADDHRPLSVRQPPYVSPTHTPPASAGVRRPREEGAGEGEEEAAAKRAKPSPAHEGGAASYPPMHGQGQEGQVLPGWTHPPFPPVPATLPRPPPPASTVVYKSPTGSGGAGGGGGSGQAAVAATKARRAAGSKSKGKGAGGAVVSKELQDFLDAFKQYLETEHRSAHTKHMLSALTVQNRINHARRISLKHKIDKFTNTDADRLLQEYPEDPNVYNMLKDVRVFLAWEHAKLPAGAAAGGGGESEGAKDGDRGAGRMEYLGRAAEEEGDGDDDDGAAYTVYNPDTQKQQPGQGRGQRDGPGEKEDGAPGQGYQDRAGWDGNKMPSFPSIGRKRTACEACVAKKVHCDLDRDDNLPCTRCINKGEECLTLVGVDADGNPQLVRRISRGTSEPAQQPGVAVTAV